MKKRPGLKTIQMSTSNSTITPTIFEYLYTIPTYQNMHHLLSVVLKQEISAHIRASIIAKFPSHHNIFSTYAWGGNTATFRDTLS
jgi:hypothetical protein